VSVDAEGGGRVVAALRRCRVRLQASHPVAGKDGQGAARLRGRGDRRVGLRGFGVRRSRDARDEGHRNPNSGSKKAPAPFGGTWILESSSGAGIRPPSPVFWAWSWEGVVANPKGFKTCTVVQIDAAQSDAGCPKGSQIGTTSQNLIAQFGPQTDKTQNLTCNGKGFTFYNAGPGQIALFIEGPADQCGGIDYLAPLPVIYTKKGKSTEFKIVWPNNITQPLPGLESALNSGGGAFPVTKTKYKQKGKTVKSSFLQSVGCSGKTRDLVYTVDDVENPAPEVFKTSAGPCKQPKKAKKK
jgi:hypothetical protein